ncbi:Hsp20/alpha crystallin family protein [Aequorivita xiaoshiensis]|uniref:Hsp20/alpha crystallin family protein n=1 Tax=Aequorivita xiaoshiensis TaxID=2874476 RepID=A0A9X1U4F6_9FLAO|nr:Hsp20/alpha crystallin family protein [Aequorivita xiaoshiensis]MCG2431759.1 Hsp20/alpha crystallin family protein [Aequorivita xiaoshiensis]
MKTVNNNNMWLPSLLDNIFLENRLDRLNNYETFSNPAVNIIENLSNFVVELAAPGLQKENFSIEVEEDTLKIAYEVKESQEEEQKNDNAAQYKRREFNFGSFEKSFKLPENVNVEDILANYEDGVLKVTLPKMEEKKVLKRMVEIS